MSNAVCCACRSSSDRWFTIRVYASTDGGIEVYFVDITERNRTQETTGRLAAVESWTPRITPKARVASTPVLR
jgi:hypothetical protein